MPQIRAVAAALIAVAKSRGVATVLVGHVTKDGGIAGPRVLEHLVDVVLHFEGDRHSSLRLVRATKNRFGAADEVGCFEMGEDGIVGLADPSGLFLSDRAVAVPGTCVAVTMEGRRPLVAEVQALTCATTAAARRGERSATWTRRGWRCCSRCSTAPTPVPYPDMEVYASTVGGIRRRRAGRRPGRSRWRCRRPSATARCRRACARSARCRCPATCAGSATLDRRLAEAARLGFSTALVPGAHAGEPLSAAASQGIRTVPVSTLVRGDHRPR